MARTIRAQSSYLFWSSKCRMRSANGSPMGGLARAEDLVSGHAVCLGEVVVLGLELYEVVDGFLGRFHRLLMW